MKEFSLTLGLLVVLVIVIIIIRIYMITVDSITERLIKLWKKFMK